MYRAGLPLSKMRLCQPYGDDQRRGLNLFHVLEPKTWVKIVNRVNGANSGALYIQENGNINGYNKITLPAGHNWETYSKLIFSTMPKITQEHYIKRFRVFIKWWKKRGYPDGIGDEAPIVLENKGLAPSWRRIAKVLLRNDYWCKGLKFSQPKSEAWKKFVSDRKKNNPVSGPSSKKVR
jgi:predicted phosphoadenosine phosphosulfate sulfurtransferase